MALTVLDHNTAAGSIGAAFRRQRQGPEAELVSAFLKNFPIDIPRGCHGTVFCEPRIESGFPDLVVVLWSVAAANEWRSERAELNQQDIRLVHYLHDAGPKTQCDLLPLFNRGLTSSLERIAAARMIRQVGDRWKPISIWNSFAVRRIIAIEAKISEWAIALDQAHLNTWFASDSFVLMPKNKHQPHVKAAARSRGVRLCTPDDLVSCKRPVFPGRLPRSYASWLFNEWSWRFAQQRGGLHA